MSEYLIQDTTLTALANKIRSVTSETGQLTPAQMVSALDNVTAGGSDKVGDSYRFSTIPSYGYPQDASGSWTASIDGSSYSLSIGDSYGDVYADSNNSRLGALPYAALIQTYPAFSGELSSIEALPFFSELINAAVGRFRPIEIKLPNCTALYDSSIFSNNYMLISVELPSCTYVDDGAFDNNDNLERIVLPTNCQIDGTMVNCNNLQGQTLKVYLYGATVGTCSETAFGTPDDEETGFDNLEIYVPADLVNDFKTTWANGVYANNIYPLPSENS